ncbi:hypothetical protein HHX47_DHR2001051 [Lentinula edodes]|nr:hypothetical protein HHX47_DHR2001051 [Lentinula edodes]
MSDTKNMKEDSTTGATAIYTQTSSVHSLHSSTTIHDHQATTTDVNVNYISHDHEKVKLDHDQHHHDPSHEALGHGESAIPTDKKEEEIENLQDDWEDDPINARNWLSSKKWTSVAIVLHFGTLFSLAFNLGCAFAPNAGAFIGFRLLRSAPIACGGGSIGDLFSERDRASAMAIYSLGPLIGPAVGPVAGGFIAQTIGTKYVFIVIAAACGVSLLLGVPLLQETYAPVIRLRRARAEGDLEKAKHFHGPISDMGKWEYLWLNLSRPVILLTRSFICFMLSLYMAFMYGIYYLMFTTFPELFNVIYGFDTGIGGLVYLGLGIGFLVATMFGAKTADQIYHYLATKNGGKGKPEMRIPALAFGSLWVPVGLFWYGWSAQAQIHWIMPIIGSGIFGFGMMTTFLPIQLYLVDAFQFAASALAAAAVLRSILGFAFPLFGAQMYAALGYGGGNSLLGGLAIVLGIPFPIWIYYKGEQMRARNSLTRTE